MASFQVNRSLVDNLVEIALSSAEGATALDLYAGAGLYPDPPRSGLNKFMVRHLGMPLHQKVTPDNRLPLTRTDALI